MTFKSTLKAPAMIRFSGKLVLASVIVVTTSIAPISAQNNQCPQQISSSADGRVAWMVMPDGRVRRCELYEYSSTPRCEYTY